MHQVGALSAEFGGTEGSFEAEKLKTGGIDAGFDRAGFVPRGERFGHKNFGGQRFGGAARAERSLLGSLK